MPQLKALMAAGTAPLSTVAALGSKTVAILAALGLVLLLLSGVFDVGLRLYRSANGGFGIGVQRKGPTHHEHGRSDGDDDAPPTDAAA